MKVRDHSSGQPYLHQVNTVTTAERVAYGVMPGDQVMRHGERSSEWGSFCRVTLPEMWS